MYKIDRLVYCIAPDVYLISGQAFQTSNRRVSWSKESGTHCAARSAGKVYAASYGHRNRICAYRLGHSCFTTYYRSCPPLYPCLVTDDVSEGWADLSTACAGPCFHYWFSVLAATLHTSSFSRGQLTATLLWTVLSWQWWFVKEVMKLLSVTGYPVWSGLGVSLRMYKCVGATETDRGFREILNYKRIQGELWC